MKLRRDIPSQYRREDAVFAKSVSMTRDYDELDRECNQEKHIGAFRDDGRLEVRAVRARR